ncbi:hypothetical protein GBA52_024883 [Prunus armeniaca]|nr:hypothetical protein GBA52_024883 [Prunus armeniaca]
MLDSMDFMAEKEDVEEVVCSFDKVLSLTNEEQDGLHIESDDTTMMNERLHLCLVGTVFTDQGFNREAFKQTMLRAWGTMREVGVKDLRDNLFLFTFTTMRDKEMVIRGGPWNFDKQLVLLETPDGNRASNIMVLQNADFWVQAHNLPLNRMTVKTGARLEIGWANALM